MLAATQSETPVPPKSDSETWPSKRQRNAEKSSLQDEAKTPPPQASGKRREFDPLEVNFVRYLKCLIRGGARWIRTRHISRCTA